VSLPASRGHAAPAKPDVLARWGSVAHYKSPRPGRSLVLSCVARPYTRSPQPAYNRAPG